jgi:hypothetical protein
MGKLFQKDIQSLRQTEIFGHYFLEDGILRIYDNVNVVISQIDLKGFGFYCQR